MTILGRHLRCLAALTLLSVGAASASESVDFELARLDGRGFLRLSTLPGLVAINFWDTECPPCGHEMPMLDNFYRGHPDLSIIGVSLSRRAATLDFLEAYPVSYVQLSGPTEPRGLLRRFGDPAGALPHTVVLRDDHSICAAHTGEVDQNWLDAALWRCRSVVVPGKRR